MADYFTIHGDMLAGGKNDTPLPYSRLSNQQKELKNARIRPDRIWEKTQARKQVGSSIGTDITGLICPKATIPLVDFDATNKALYCHDGTDYQTANMAEGKVYDYTTLASTLQTALQSAIDIDVTVSYSTSTDKFTITNNSGATIKICWYHDSTTLDPTLFGYMEVGSSVSIADSGTSSSDFAVDSEPPCQGNKRYISTTGAMYDEDGNEVYLADGSTSIDSSPNDFVGVWFNDKFYGSNGVKNYIMRDRYLRKALTSDLLAVHNVALNVDPGSGGFENNHDITGVDTANDTFTISGTVNESIFEQGVKFRVIGSAGNDGEWEVESSSSGGGSTTITVTGDITDGTVGGTIYVYSYVHYQPTSDSSYYLELDGANGPTEARFVLNLDTHKLFTKNMHRIIDNMQLALAYVTAQDYKVELYWEIPSKNTSYLCKTIQANDLTTSMATYTYNENLKDIRPSDTYDHYLRIKLVPFTSSSTGKLRIYGTSGSSDIYYADTDGVWKEAAGPTCKVFAMIYTSFDVAAGTYKYKVTFRNIDGYESEPSDELSYTSDENSCIKVTVTNPATNYDYEWIRLYRTIDSGSAYYLVAEMRADSLGGATTAATIDPLTDAIIAGEDTLDDETTRRSDQAYTRAEAFDNRLFYLIGNHAVYFSESGEPENQGNTLENNVIIGTTGNDCTALKASQAGDRIYVFKNNMAATLYPTGSAITPYQKSESLEGYGTVSPRALITVPELPYCFGIAQNGHVFRFDSRNMELISQGRMDTFIATLDLAYLDKASVIYDPDRQLIKWSLVTSGNTTPDTSLVYDVRRDAFSVEDSYADYWIQDAIAGSEVAGTSLGADYTGATLLLGASNQRLFYDRFADSDYNPSGPSTDNIDLDIETADLGCGTQDYKSFMSLDLWGYADASKNLTVQWYLDQSTSAFGSATIALTTSAAKHTISMGGMGENIRLRFTDDSQTGRVYIGWLRVGYNKKASVKL